VPLVLIESFQVSVTLCGTGAGAGVWASKSATVVAAGANFHSIGVVKLPQGGTLAGGAGIQNGEGCERNEGLIGHFSASFGALFP
jgi:hypothetical protein